jgi:hypothetical protein
MLLPMTAVCAFCVSQRTTGCCCAVRSKLRGSMSTGAARARYRAAATAATEAVLSHAAMLILMTVLAAPGVQRSPWWALFYS